MGKILRVITLVGLIFMMGSCAVPKTMFQGMHKKHWLLGAWKDQKGHTTEEWKFVNKNVLSGKMYSVVSRDTLTVQTYKLERNGKDVIYTAAMQETNNTFVKFMLKSEVPNMLVFENTKDDFPKNITYIFTEPNTLTEVIEGKEANGDYKKREFTFTKATASGNKK